MPVLKIVVVPTPEEVAGRGAELVRQRATEILANQGHFSLALSGGRTPQAMFQLLASEPYRRTIDWKRVRIYFVDERAVPPDHAESNYRLANETLLSKIQIPRENIHRMRGEIDPNEAAIEYGRLLKQHFGDGGPDLVFLGMGPDGHTASLFPHTNALKETHHRCVANHVEKLNAWRITMSAPFINRARTICVTVTGSDKAQTVRDVLQGPRDPEQLPIQMIDPASHDFIWIMDAGAAQFVKPA